MQPMQIPKIIHQIWDGQNEPLPNFLSTLGDTWKELHPDWQYEFWDHERMISFLKARYPDYWDRYYSFKHNVQRWDVIRYLILETYGGMYVDFDYECLDPLDDLLSDKLCCFAQEPEEHMFYQEGIYFNNALMASIPAHPFIGLINREIFNHPVNDKKYPNKMIEVLETTGPVFISKLYHHYQDKDSVYIIPSELVSPLTKVEVDRYIFNEEEIEKNKETEEYLNRKLEKAIAVHYFLGSWCK